MEEVARFLGLVEDRENAAVEFLVVTIILPRYTFVKEPLLGNAVMGVLRYAPIELPTCIGPQFIVTAIECVLQHEAAMRLTVLQFKLLATDEVTILIQQLGIEDTADTARRPCVAAADVSLVVDGVAQEVACVVHVNKNLFLRNRLAELFKPVCPTFECGGCLC